MGRWTDDLERAIADEIDTRIASLRRPINMRDIYNIMAMLQVEAENDPKFKDDMRQLLKFILREG